MHTTSIDQRLSSNSTTVWTARQTTARFGLTIKPRSGAISYVGSVLLADAVLRLDPDGELSIDFSLDPEGLEVDRHADPRLSASGVRAADGGLVRFRSSAAQRLAADRFLVTGQAVVGESELEVRFVLELTERPGGLAVTAATRADHRNLGVTWLGSLGHLKTPTQLVVRANLVAADESRRQVADRDRDRDQSIVANDRYRFMASGHAH